MDRMDDFGTDPNKEGDELRLRLEQYEKAVTRLQEGVAADIPDEFKNDMIIQRFEFCYELSWKLLKKALYVRGVEANFPKEVLRAAFEGGYLEDANQWRDLSLDRT